MTMESFHSNTRASANEILSHLHTLLSAETDFTRRTLRWETIYLFSFFIILFTAFNFVVLLSVMIML